MSTSRELLPRRAMEMFGLELSAGELERFDRFVELLSHWNSRVNLVAVRSSQQLVDRHVLDSLALTALTRTVAVAADLGSGGGFPGIPMAVTAPRTRLHLFEAREKKAMFLREAVRVLGLGNVAVWPIRAEDWREPQRLELVAVRGIRSEVAMSLARPMLASGGKLVLMRKQGEKSPEVAAYEDMHRFRYRLPGGERHEVQVFRLRT